MTLDSECMAGYLDGLRGDPAPGPNRHPAYIHGFLNGSDDRNKKPRKPAAEIRKDWAFIEATCGEAP